MIVPVAPSWGQFGRFWSCAAASMELCSTFYYGSVKNHPKIYLQNTSPGGPQAVAEPKPKPEHTPNSTPKRYPAWQYKDKVTKIYQKSPKIHLADAPASVPAASSSFPGRQNKRAPPCTELLEICDDDVFGESYQPGAPAYSASSTPCTDHAVWAG